MKNTTRYSICQNISKLISCIHIWCADDTVSEFFFDKISINFNILGSIMLDQVVSNTIATLLSQYNLIGSLESNPSSFKSIFNHNVSFSLGAMALNSTFALDLVTTYCFLLCHIIKLPPTNVHVVYRLSIIEPSQFAFL
jgi:hypothetical protein